MRFISIEKLEPGMALAKALLDSDNRVLLCSGKILNLELITRLQVQGYSGVYIEDALSKDIVIQEAISAELRHQASKSLKQMDIDGIRLAAKNIVNEILGTKSVSLDMVDMRTFDDYTYAHSINVAVLSSVMGLGLKYNETDMIDLCQAAIFHDIGKLQIDLNILNKPGRLTEEEMKIMQQHSQLSYDILNERWDIPAKVKMGVLSHHENEDGTGYPMGLTGDKIQEFAKIIHVADVYDALSSNRPYKKAYSYSESLEYLMGSCYTLFDVRMVNIFMKYVPVYPKGTSVQLSDGKEAIILENTMANSLRPKVLLLDGKVIDLMKDTTVRNITIVGGSGVDQIPEHSIEEHENKRKQLISED